MTQPAPMPPLDPATLDRLLAAARTAATKAYAPYSGFHVRAALLLDDGSIVTGANVENASYGLTLCAETVAVAKLANDGAMGGLRACVIIGGRPDSAGVLNGTAPVHPCGRCRQMLNEAADVAGIDLPVYCADAGGGDVRAYRLSALLPHSFGPKDLV